MTTRLIARCAAVLAAALLGATAAAAPITYLHDDGTADNAIGVTGSAHDLIWLNLFPVQAGGEVITNISVAFGSADSNNAAINGLPVTALLYGDPNGGSTTDATLLTSLAGTISGSGTNTFVNFDITDTPVVGNFLVGILARNLASGTFLIAIDQTDPDLAGRSFVGFVTPAGTLNENNLASIPTYGAIESLVFPGNWLVRATAVANTPVPEPGSLSLIVVAGAAAVVGWGRRRVARVKAA